MITETPGWLHRELLLGVSWFEVFASVLALGLVLVSAILARRLFNRILGALPSGGYPRPLQLILDAARGPLLLTLWAYGTAAAVYPLLEGFTQADGSNPAQATLLVVARFSAVVALFWLLVGLALRVIRRVEYWAGTRGNAFDRFIVPLLVRSLPIILPVLALFISLPLLELPPALTTAIGNTASILLIGAIAWTLILLTRTLEKLLLHRFRIDVADNLQARRIYTQTSVLRKVAVVIILLVSLASVLMVFDTMRQIGTSLLASAGIAGLVLGLAAQRVLGNILAGFQIAITQPIRIDDAVVVEGEWGWVEELTLTYVVVRLWDLRRLVLPITYFIDNPFQNWTRTSSALLGSVFLYVDYSVPVARLREELSRIVENSPLWDGKVCALQVTDSREYVIELRALVSAASGGEAWELRCEVREQLIAFLHRHYPESLPKLRTELQRDRPPPRPTEDLA